MKKCGDKIVFKKLFSYYSDFNIKKITEPKFRHLFLLLVWPAYIVTYVLTEKFISGPFHDIYCSLDVKIPFCEFFVIPYVLWYAMLAFVGLYTLFFDVPSFRKFHKFLIIACVITFTFYIIFPNEQNLRPNLDGYARDNICVDIMRSLYKNDTNTNVFPSVHVIFSLGMLFTMWDSKHFSGWLSRTIVTLLALLVCLATVFLKQHSLLDLLAGAALAFALYPFTFVKRRRKKKKFKKEEIFS